MTASRLPILVVCLLGGAAATCSAQVAEPLKVEALGEGPPAAQVAGLEKEFEARGVRLLDAQGKPFADLWLRKAVPAAGKYEGPKGAVLYPVLAQGELLGVIRYHGEGQDYRDQVISPGVYTLRYGLQPINGDHLGVSAYRDFALLVPAALDRSAAPLDQKALDSRSAEASGTNHPAVLMLVPAPSGKPAPAVAFDEEKNLWGVVFAVPLRVPGEAGATSLPVQMIVVGSAPA